MSVYKRDEIIKQDENCSRDTDIEILKLNQENINKNLCKITDTLDKFSDKFDKIMKSLEGQIRIEEKLNLIDKDVSKLEKNLEDSYRYRQKVDDMDRELSRIHDEHVKNKYWIYGIFGTLLVFILTFTITQITDLNKNNQKIVYTSGPSNKKNP